MRFLTLGVALTAIPIRPLRGLVGKLLLLFGLQWFRKGIARVAARGLAGYDGRELEEEAGPSAGMDWVAFVLAFKGVLLEGLEVAFIVVSFEATAGHLGPAIFVGASAVVVIGTFWALEGLGVNCGPCRPRTPCEAQGIGGRVVVNACVRAVAGVGRFVYRFVVVDDWLVAVVMLLALVVTAGMVASGINAWWLVPLLAVSMTGVSLWRRSAAANG